MGSNYRAWVQILGWYCIMESLWTDLYCNKELGFNHCKGYLMNVKFYEYVNEIKKKNVRE